MAASGSLDVTLLLALTTTGEEAAKLGILSDDTLTLEVQRSLVTDPNKAKDADRLLLRHYSGLLTVAKMGLPGIAKSKSLTTGNLAKSIVQLERVFQDVIEMSAKNINVLQKQ